jgi:siroheme synthase-like protein
LHSREIFFYLKLHGVMAGSSPPSALQFKDLSSAMKYFPLFMDLEGREVLLAGGGEKALQKLRLLSRTKARVTVVAETATAEVVAAAELGNVLLQLRTLRPDDVKGKAVALGAYEDPRRNAELSEAARAAGVPVNIVDAPDLSTVIVPAIVDRDPVVVAIGTEGAAPIIARDLRARIESWLPADFGRVARYAAASSGKGFCGDHFVIAHLPAIWPVPSARSRARCATLARATGAALCWSAADPAIRTC